MQDMQPCNICGRKTDAEAGHSASGYEIICDECMNRDDMPQYVYDYLTGVDTSDGPGARTWIAEKAVLA